MRSQKKKQLCATIFPKRKSNRYIIRKSMKKLKVGFWMLGLLSSTIASAQIVVTNVQTPEELVEDVLVGAGVIISNVEFNTSVPLAESIQVQAGYFDATGTTFPMEKGIILATGNCNVAVGPNTVGGASDNVGVATPPDPSDPDLDDIATSPIFNPAILEFDFIPSGDSLVFNYIFASEEYLEFVDAGVNDVFGFFISGPGFAGPFTDGAENIATIPGTAIPVSIDDLNDADYPEFYVNNDGGDDVQYDGHTTILSARAKVECGELYHIKIAIGDAGDPVWDSGVFLEASSFSSNGISVEIASVLGEAALIEGCDSAQVCFIRPTEADTIDLYVDFEISGSAINGTDYPLLDETIFFPLGEDTVKVYIVPIDDGLIEGTEDIIITIEIINECGDTILTTATIEVIDPYEIELTTEDIILECAEDSVLLTFITDGVPDLDITWSTGGTDIEEWVPGDVVGTTTYTIDIIDVCGEIASGTINVILDPASDMFLTFNEDLFIVCPDQEIDIDATVNDPFDVDLITYEWDPTGETVEDITTSPLVEGWYYLSVFDGCFTVTDSVKIDFDEVILDNIIVTDAEDCPGIPGATLGGIIVDPDNPAWTYELVGYAGPGTSGVFTDLAGGIDYILIVTDENGCFIDSIVTVGLGDNEVLATWEPDSLRNVTCNGDMDGGAYIFDISGGITPPYDVTWTNVGGVFDVDTSVPVDGSSEQDGLSGGTWTVTVTDEEGCAWSQSFEIFEPEELTLDLIWNQPSCYGFSDGSITVNTEGGNGGEIYTMTDADGTLLNEGNSNTINTIPTGTYSITVVDENGCTVSQDFFLDEPGELDATIEITQPLCYGIESGYVEVVDVINYQGDYDEIGYFWAPPNPAGNGIGVVSTKNLGDGEYTVTINDANGCSKVFDFTIVYPDEIILETGYSPAYCRLHDYQSGNGEVFGSGTGGTDGLTYSWENLGNGETHTPTTWGGLNPGIYEFSAEDGNGCLVTDTVAVDSLNPIAAFTIDSDQLNEDCKGTADVEVEFTNTSKNYSNPKNPEADPRFFWNLDSPTDDWYITDDFNEKMDTVYKARGVSYEMEACLVVQNKNGCKDTTCKIITIFEPIAIDNVNIFSPDGDGINDVFTFEFVAKSISIFDCVIVNRWGIQVGEINDISSGWDGTDMNGDLVSDGVYFYNYRAEADNGKKLTGQGTITKVTGK